MEGFNGNIGLLDRGVKMAGDGRVGDGQGGWEPEEKSQFKKSANPNLSMDRKRSASVGGLGRREDDEEGGCCCIVS